MAPPVVSVARTVVIFGWPFLNKLMDAFNLTADGLWDHAGNSNTLQDF